MHQERRPATDGRERIHRVQEEAYCDGHLVSDRRAGRQSDRQAGQGLVDRDVADRQEQFVLALEIRVNRPDRQSALANDVLHRRVVETALAKDTQGSAKDALANLLLVLAGDSRHSRSVDPT